MIRAVFDTNIVVSALLTPQGNAASALLAAQRGQIEPCVSTAILEEYRAVLTRKKFGFTAGDVKNALAVLQAGTVVLNPPPSGLASPDPDDTKFIDCGIAAGADCLVTGNRRDFPDAPYGTMQVVSAVDMLGLLPFGHGFGR